MEYFIVERDNKWFTQNLNNRLGEWDCLHGFDFMLCSVFSVNFRQCSKANYIQSRLKKSLNELSTKWRNVKEGEVMNIRRNRERKSEWRIERYKAGMNEGPVYERGGGK